MKTLVLIFLNSILLQAQNPSAKDSLLFDSKLGTCFPDNDTGMFAPGLRYPPFFDSSLVSCLQKNFGKDGANNILTNALLGKSLDQFQVCITNVQRDTFFVARLQICTGYGYIESLRLLPSIQELLNCLNYGSCLLPDEYLITRIRAVWQIVNHSTKELIITKLESRWVIKE